MNIRLLEAAKDDLRSGWSFYEQKSPGLGNTFIAAIDSDVQTLALYAGTHLKLDGFYRMLIIVWRPACRRLEKHAAMRTRRLMRDLAY